MTTSTLPVQRLTRKNLEVTDIGEGRPVLFLHSWLGTDVSAPALRLLAESARVIIPSHPGFGGSEGDADVRTVDDLADFYLDLLEEGRFDDVAVVGASFGAWIAVKMVLRSRSSRISRLILCDAFGVKIGGREDRDIVDIFAVSQNQLASLAYADPSSFPWRPQDLSDADLLTFARNRESAARYGWVPYMHEPRLKEKLRRISVPTLFLWGAADRIVTPEYGRAYASLFPDAGFQLIEGAGHFPHVEQPEAFAGAIRQFLAEGKMEAA